MPCLVVVMIVLAAMSDRRRTVTLAAVDGYAIGARALSNTALPRDWQRQQRHWPMSSSSSSSSSSNHNNNQTMIYHHHHDHHKRDYLPDGNDGDGRVVLAVGGPGGTVTRRNPSLLYTMDMTPALVTSALGELAELAMFKYVDERVATILKQSYRQRAFLDGDVIIGVLLPIHRPASAKSYPVRCSIIWEDYGMHRMQHLIWTIEEINRNQQLLPGVKIGYDIRDTCWTTQVALERTMDFIKSKAGDDYQCSSGGSLTPNSPLAAVLGAASSEISVAVQEVAQMFDIPQVDFGATSPQLSDKDMFRLFARVIPSDQQQAKMLVDIVRYFRWQYVHGVYTEGNYGEKGYEAFREVLDNSGICLASSRKFLLRVPDSHDQYSSFIVDLLKHPDTRVIVCFCDGLGVRALFRALTKHNLNGSYVIVGSDGWNVRKDIVRGFESAASGGMSVTHFSPPIRGFEDRFYGLTPFMVKHQHNPWFTEYWSQKHGCTMPANALLGLADSPFVQGRNETSASRRTRLLLGQRLAMIKRRRVRPARTATAAPLDFTKPGLTATAPPLCSGREVTPRAERLKQDAKLGFVANSVYAVAHAIRATLRGPCWGKTIRTCEHLYPFVNGSMLFEQLRSIVFENYAGEQVRFDANMDGVGKYRLWNFQQRPDGTYAYMPIGEWDSRRGLHINNSRVVWPANASRQSRSIVTSLSLTANNDDDSNRNRDNDIDNDNGRQQTMRSEAAASSTAVPESFCSKPCAFNQIKLVPNAALACCWDCLACPAGAYIANGTTCVACQPGWAPNQRLSHCEQVSVRFRHLSQIESVVMVTIASVGMLGDVGVWFIYYLTHRLSVQRSISLIGILATFSTVFSLLARPTLMTCYFARTLPPLAQAILFAPMFNRANAMVRIVNSSRKLVIDRRPRFISTNSQFALTCFIIGAQCTVVVMMLIWTAADVKIVYPSYNIALLICRSTFPVIAIPLGFNAFFQFSTMVYALRTRKIKQMIRSDESAYYPMVAGSNAVVSLSSILFYYAMGTEEPLVASAHQLMAGFTTLVMFILPIFQGPEQVNFDHNFQGNVRQHVVSQQQRSSSTAADLAQEELQRINKKPMRRRSVSLRLWDTMTVMREVAANTHQNVAAASHRQPSSNELFNILIESRKLAPSGRVSRTASGTPQQARRHTARSASHTSIASEDQRISSGESTVTSSRSPVPKRQRFFSFRSSSGAGGGSPSSNSQASKRHSARLRSRGGLVLVTGSPITDPSPKQQDDNSSEATLQAKMDDRESLSGPSSRRTRHQQNRAASSAAGQPRSRGTTTGTSSTISDRSPVTPDSMSSRESWRNDDQDNNSDDMNNNNNNNSCEGELSDSLGAWVADGAPSRRRNHQQFLLPPSPSSAPHRAARRGKKQHSYQERLEAASAWQHQGRQTSPVFTGGGDGERAFGIDWKLGRSSRDDDE